MSFPVSDKLLRELNEGEKFAGFAILRRMDVRQKKDGSLYLALEFADRSGRLGGKVWDHVEEFRKVLSVGKIVKLMGVITTYQDQKEIHIERLRPAVPEDAVDRTRLIPTSERPVEEMHRHLRRLVEGVTQPQMRTFLRAFFEDPAVAERYFQAPAGKQWHHCYLGGLAEHSLNMAEVLLKIAEFYPHADRDLLVAGALLHDIGKIEELDWETGIDYTDRGRLLGHIVIGQEILNAHQEKLQEIPEELRLHLMHLVLSHQGTREQGSPVVPMTLEAILLYLADEMDSKANAFNRIIQRSREQGDRWTEWVQLLNRYLYAGEKLSEKSQSDPAEEDTLF
jgi:3'-5' exoribonuclease